MNRLEKTFFEFRTDLARNPDGLNDAELDALLSGRAKNSDANLRAAAELFALDLTSIEEHAARLQYGDGLSRAAANREALTYELQCEIPGIPNAFGRWLIHHAATTVAYCRKNRLTIEQVALELQRYFQRFVVAKPDDQEATNGQAI